MQNVVCVLSVRPSVETYQFYRKLKLKTNYDVYIVIDDDSFDTSAFDNVVTMLKVNRIECETHGFKSSVLWLSGRACSRDKALYYFSNVKIDYKFIWLIEDDVFVPNARTLVNMDKQYREGDLLSASHEILHTIPDDWHWKHVLSQTQLKPPFGRSMICAIRCSTRMLRAIRAYATRFKDLFLDESLFNTLAIKNNLQVKVIPELDSILYPSRLETFRR